MRIVKPAVTPIAWTHFTPPEEIDWDTDAEGGEGLAEFAGRACYQSWSKPNPATATNAGYLRHILEVGHLSVLEHGTVTFYMTGISRSLTHELIRHRHFSYSQLSQRYVTADGGFVEPDIIAEDPELHDKFVDAMWAAAKAYAELNELLDDKLADQPHCPTCFNRVDKVDDRLEQWWCATCNKGLFVVNMRPVAGATARRKQARQAARSVLPNAAETRIVVTGNYRAWRHFITMRATEHADVEIRALAVQCLRHLQQIAANVFADYTITTLDDGSEAAASPYAWES